MTPCGRCIVRGKTWSGSDPKCAFLTGIFDSDNWNCATMNKLRAISESRAFYSDDRSLGVISYEGCFVTLGWYKSRGRTEFARVVDGIVMNYLDLELAESIIMAGVQCH